METRRVLGSKRDVGKAGSSGSPASDAPCNFQSRCWYKRGRGHTETVERDGGPGNGGGGDRRVMVVVKLAAAGSGNGGSGGGFYAG